MNSLINNKITYRHNPGYLVKFILISVVFLVALAGCTGIPLSYYDTTTYKNLTNLKVETTMLVASFDSKSVNKNATRIESVTMNLRKAYEYEKGKGEANSETMRQFRKIVKLFEGDVKDYRENGPKSLGKKYYREAAVVLGQAFDIAISTENLKNKDKR